MNKFVVAAASAVAILGLAGCGDTDGTTTQGVPPQEQQLQQQEPLAAPPPATDQQEPQAPAN